MRAFLDKKKGRNMRIIIDLNAQRQPTHYYEGTMVTLVEDILILKDVQLGEIAVNTSRIVAIQVAEAPEAASTFVTE